MCHVISSILKKLSEPPVFCLPRATAFCKRDSVGCNPLTSFFLSHFTKRNCLNPRGLVLFLLRRIWQPTWWWAFNIMTEARQESSMGNDRKQLFHHSFSLSLDLSLSHRHPHTASQAGWRSVVHINSIPVFAYLSENEQTSTQTTNLSHLYPSRTSLQCSVHGDNLLTLFCGPILYTGFQRGRWHSNHYNFLHLSNSSISSHLVFNTIYLFNIF